MPKLTTAQIGRAGEILVQYRLLKHGIDSAPMTTDSGIDLVAYAPRSKRALTVQVKANERPKPAGGKGFPALGWWLRENSPAELVALVDLQEDRVWLLWHAEIVNRAQQRSAERLHLYFYSDASYAPKNEWTHISDFAAFELNRRIVEIFGGAHDQNSN